MSKFSWDPEQFGRIFQLAHDESRRWIETLPEKKVRADCTVDELRTALGIELTDDGVDSESTLRHLVEASRPGLMGSPGPRFFGFVIGGSFPVTVGADWLVSSWDQNAGLYSATPAASMTEEIAARWMLEVLNLPADCGVGFVTGGQMANTTAIMAARHAVLRNEGWDVEEQGLQGAPAVNVIVGQQAHATIFTSLRYAGFGQANALRIDADDQGRMKIDALRETLRSLEGPIIICTQAGNVNSGAFDPLDEIVPLAHEREAWVHVDGAFGLWALASPEYRHLAKGVELADSWATDAHKWLNVPYDNGIVIVRDRTAHLGATSVKAAYLIHADGTDAPRDPLDWTPEFSRRARGTTVYAALMYLGRNGVAELIERGCRQATAIARKLEEVEGISVLNDVVLNQVLVDFQPPPGLDHDPFIARLIGEIQEEGTLWLSGTQWLGRSAMRISISNWSTSDEDIERSAEAITRCYRKLVVGR
ncbi:MAG: aminotransferase class V-fold PLP-dependent enzyme [Acidobacteria bacterium]|nr:aminotransferase class V-fold PLP-dependent enzyme [Acidobacteriota bacterium]